MRAKEVNAVDMVKRYGSIIDIGQISLPDRRRLNYLALKGVIEKVTCYHFPIPKTKYVWVEAA